MIKCKTGVIFLLVCGAIIFSLPLGAQLEEAIKVPWPGFHVLQGRWQARNGDVMTIKNISATGSIELQYFEAEPVHVTQAQAARDGKATRIQIVLRYPDSLCCTYDLTYNPQSDQLKGLFWRKGTSKSTEVIFNRMGPKP